MKLKIPGWMLLGTLLGCSAASNNAAPGASAELQDKDGKIIGVATFRQAQRGLVVHLQANGLTPGLHAVHVYAVGKCDGPAFTSAGPHFNPHQRKHGLKPAEGAHAGDLPNMLIAKDGSGRFEVLADAMTLGNEPTSLFDADGSAVIIHAGNDDYSTDPTGNAGDRIACGVVQAVR